MTKENNTNREHKATLFHVLFSDRKTLLTLYNAVNHTAYDNPAELTITTLEDVIYIGMKNDLSFLIGHTLNLYEHQSTWNPNMPLRGLLYFAELYQGYVEENKLDLYTSTQLKLPMPQFIVFYNGEKDQEDRKVLRLSDAFPNLEGKAPCLECNALMLNINIGHNKELLNQCRKLNEYAIFVEKVRTHTANGLKLKAAIDLAADECIQEEVLADLLRKNRAEVCNMLLREYDEAAHIENEKKISYEEGQEKTQEKLFLMMIEDYLAEGFSKEQIVGKLVNRYGVTQEKAEEYFAKFQGK